jgi:cation/acetate symporter
VGLVTAIVLVVLGPAVWVDVFGNERPIFPQAYPALYSVTFAFFTMWLVSILDRSEQAKEDREKFQVMKAI